MSATPRFYHEVLTGTPTPTRARRHVNRRALIVAGVLVLLAGFAYCVVRLVTRTLETAAALSAAGIHLDGIPWTPLLVIGSLLMLRVVFKAGQYHRGWMHARGIRKSHWLAIRGGKH